LIPRTPGARGSPPPARDPVSNELVTVSGAAKLTDIWFGMLPGGCGEVAVGANGGGSPKLARGVLCLLDERRANAVPW
jgi:hypothetical protein